MIVTCEAFALAQKLGLDPQVFFDISSKASGQSWSMTSYAPVPGVGPDTPADHDYEGGFAAALMLKDLKLADEAAKSVGAYTPMGGEAEELYQRFVDRGGGSKDFSGIIKMIDDSWKVPDNNRGGFNALACLSPLIRGLYLHVRVDRGRAPPASASATRRRASRPGAEDHARAPRRHAHDRRCDQGDSPRLERHARSADNSPQCRQDRSELSKQAGAGSRRALVPMSARPAPRPKSGRIR